MFLDLRKEGREGGRKKGREGGRKGKERGREEGSVKQFVLLKVNLAYLIIGTTPVVLPWGKI